jgi:uncharacterized FlaG/YvyC family protein
MDKKVTEKRKTRRRTSDDVIKAFSSDLSTILDILNRELNEIDKEVFLISETSPFLGRRKEDWELQAEVTRKLKEITNELGKVLKKVPGKIH